MPHIDQVNRSDLYVALIEAAGCPMKLIELGLEWGCLRYA